MNQALRREEIIRTLENEAQGSFWVVHRALADASRQARSSSLDLEAVRKRIREILAEADKQSTEAAE